MKKTLLLLFSLLCFSLGATTARPGGKDYALFIAVEQYDNSSSWKTLPGLIQECKDIRSDLVSRYGFAEESKVLENPTLSEVKSELARWRARTYGPDDQLLVFFSGHGKFLDDLQEGFFIPRDGKPGGANSELSWYSLLQLPRHINTIPCRHILLAIDACYSGTIDSRVALKDETEDWATPSNTGDAQFNQYVHDLLANKSRILMTSGGKRARSILPILRGISGKHWQRWVARTGSCGFQRWKNSGPWTPAGRCRGILKVMRQEVISCSSTNLRPRRPNRRKFLQWRTTLTPTECRIKRMLAPQKKAPLPPKAARRIKRPLSLFLWYWKIRFRVH